MSENVGKSVEIVSIDGLINKAAKIAIQNEIDCLELQGYEVLAVSALDSGRVLILYAPKRTYTPTPPREADHDVPTTP